MKRNWGKPVKKKGGRAPLRVVSGSLSMHRDGYGFVKIENGNDVFIPARYLRENLHGDRVEIELLPGGRGGKQEGRVARIVERGVSKVTGIYSVEKSAVFLRPSDGRLPTMFIQSGGPGAKSGELVVAEIVNYPSEHTPPVVKVVSVLGSPDDPAVELLAVISRYELPDSFSPALLKSAEALAIPPVESDLDGRMDLRGFTTFTIDGETARDFDDAVSISSEGDNYRLRVSIADVSHYVKPGSTIDKEAYLRGTSVYFPDRCIPMLPESLSNGICSLRPDEERLTVTADMLFSADGDQLAASFYKSIIKSAARLTYTVVSRIIEKNDPDAMALHPGLVDDLKMMQKLAGALERMRHERGSIDFDLPEAEIRLAADGSTESIIRAERNQAHKLIESFMLAANEAVASFLSDAEIPLLYRVHEQPDSEKLFSLQEVMTPLGVELPLPGKGVKPAEIQSILAKIAGKPEEHLVNKLLLRSMKQARYTAENSGHFGLAAPFYAHFTSPIRRYPDLIVHRILKWHLENRGKSRKSSPFPGYPALLIDMGEHTSKRERVAMEAERDIIELKKVLYMEQHLGEKFFGIISSVNPFGFFLELEELFVEGLVHISTLPPDRYTFNETHLTLTAEKSNTVFRIGERHRVTVAAADRAKRQIDFVLDGASKPSSRGSDEYRKVPVKGKKPAGWGRKGVKQ